MNGIFALLFGGFLALIALNAQSAEGDSSLINPDFEIAGPNSDTPLSWSLTSNALKVSLDQEVRLSGKSSVRIERNQGPAFSGINQPVDATPFRGKTVIVRGYFKGKNLQTGNAGLWLRIDGQQPASNPVSSFSKPITNDDSWVARQVVAQVGAGATRIIVAAINGTTGVLWADNFSMEVLKIDEPISLPSNVSSYLDDALEKIQANALKAPAIDWVHLRKIAYALSRNAKNSTDTHESIAFVLAQLNDRHSHLIPAARVKEATDRQISDNVDFRASLISDYGYISIPSFAAVASSRTTAYVDVAHSKLIELANNKPCGWIVDLRQNTGGNMYPMLASLSFFLGNGVHGYSISRTSKTPWEIVDGVAISGDAKAAPTKSQMIQGAISAPVAVLLGPRTASAGEAIAVSFVGRQNTRSFGQRTAGLTTANKPIFLSDGSAIALASATLADRTGQTFASSVLPDESVPAGNSSNSLSDDIVVSAASKWLANQTNCSAANKPKQ